jgi:NAD(P)-dependent dehydrogenase (short-subunit alcohol dehydrogenase family)
MFETNYFGAQRCIRAILPSMRERRTGTIVNITSLSTLFAWPNPACHATSKSALEAFSWAFAHEVRRFGVHVVTVQPGAIRTEVLENCRTQPLRPRLALHRRDATQRQADRSRVPCRRHTADVADAVLAALDPADRRVQHPVGDDAVAIFDRRSEVSLEEFVELGADASDDEYRAWFAGKFGIEL